MPLYEYACASAHVTEAIRPAECRAIFCPRCGGPADRAPAHRVAITRPEVDTRGMFRRYQEATAEMDHAASSIEQQTGQTVETPRLWSTAKAIASAMNAAGENPFQT